MDHSNSLGTLMPDVHPSRVTREDQPGDGIFRHCELQGFLPSLD